MKRSALLPCLPTLLALALLTGCERATASETEAAAQPVADETLQARNARCRELVSRAQFEEGMPLCLEVLQDAAAKDDSGLPFAQAVANAGLMFHMRGQYDDAAAFYQRAIALLEARGAAAETALARTLGDYGLMDAQRGEGERGIPRLQRALDLLDHRGDGPSQAQAALMGDLAEALEMDGQLAEAERWYRRSLEAYRSAGGNRANTGIAMNNLAALYQRLDRFDEAEALLEDAVAILAEHLAEDHPVLQMARGNLRDNARLRAEAEAREREAAAP